MEERKRRHPILFVLLGLLLTGICACVLGAVALSLTGYQIQFSAGDQAESTPSVDYDYADEPFDEPTPEPVGTLAIVVEPEPEGTPGPDEPLMPDVESPDPVALAEEEFARLEAARGRMLYNPPEEMTVDETYLVEVRLAQSEEVTLGEGLRGEGAPRIEDIPVSSFMAVRLVGDPESFRIVPRSTESQMVTADGFGHWEWDVTPLKAGDHKLVLVVSHRVKLAEFGEEQRDLPPIERVVDVQVNPASSVRTFLADNREWIIGAVAIPLLVAAGRWLWQRRQASQDQ
jgi:hypothetical protein